tara:strand:+ start:51 stop:656 length:606 start_codon:yes stop_codon:yes gene_type:complete
MKSYIYYKRRIFDDQTLIGIRQWLDGMDDFKDGYIYDQKISRSQKWYHPDLKKFSNTWKKEYDRWKPHPYCDTLRAYQDIVQTVVDKTCQELGIRSQTLNSCLINKYEDGTKLIKPHSDHQTTFGDNPIVAIVSIGDSRKLHFRPISYIHTKEKSNKDIYYNLESGSLLLMAGNTQKEYCHFIEKETHKTMRYSLTFRRHN